MRSSSHTHDRIDVAALKETKVEFCWRNRLKGHQRSCEVSNYFLFKPCFLQHMHAYSTNTENQVAKAIFRTNCLANLDRDSTLFVENRISKFRNESITNKLWNAGWKHANMKIAKLCVIATCPPNFVEPCPPNFQGTQDMPSALPAKPHHDHSPDPQRPCNKNKKQSKSFFSFLCSFTFCFLFFWIFFW